MKFEITKRTKLKQAGILGIFLMLLTILSYAQNGAIILFDFANDVQHWQVTRTENGGSVDNLHLCGNSYSNPGSSGSLAFSLTLPNFTSQVFVQSQNYDPSSMANTGNYSVLGNYSGALEFFAYVNARTLDFGESLYGKLFIRTGNADHNAGHDPTGWEYYESAWTQLSPGWMRLSLDPLNAYSYGNWGPVQHLDLLQAIGVAFYSPTAYWKSQTYSGQDYRKIEIDDVGAVVPEPTTILLLACGVLGLWLGRRKFTS